MRTQLQNCCIVIALLLHPTVAEEGACASSYDSPPLAIPTVTLHNGVEMPLLQLGTAQLIAFPGKDPSVHSTFRGMLPERGYRQIELALQKGVRAFDTAYIYRTPRSMGYVLGEWLRTQRLENRKQVWITTKIFHPDATASTFATNQMADLPHMTPEQVTTTAQKQFEANLIELGVGYVDLMLLHWPAGWKEGTAIENRQRRIAAWKVLENAYEKGWVRSIGVSNFSPDHLEQLKEDGAKILPMVNQFEASVTLQYPEILSYCQAHDIVPQAYSPFGRGYTDLPPLVFELASKYGKDGGQIALRYLYQLGYSIVYLTNTETRMVSNTDIFDFELSDLEMKALDSLNRPDGGWGLPNPHEIL
ncbi:hypothetical protein FisN_22Hu085 [Fistulifera solaris]|uniref:NADP-dependent oxidoreductase domain-containing protein n=1 Tax=Fistulifera solaris TaxID=1519565 RepID=A0A1Z5K7T4_FISSO|nr:hypothetical protein FisN_22Hu085 [Fistulifera solaris]|eukprot:GAX22294.1 hypothetical protein FisN_22Hu085 [Fistulifera solaris]